MYMYMGTHVHPEGMYEGICRLAYTWRTNRQWHIGIYMGAGDVTGLFGPQATASPQPSTRSTFINIYGIVQHIQAPWLTHRTQAPGA